MRFIIAAAIWSMLFTVGCDGAAPRPPAPIDDPAPAAKNVVVLDFTATWCNPCRRNDPAIRRLEKQGAKVIRIDIDDHPDKAAEHHVTSVPTYIVTVDGKETGRTNSPDELRQALLKYDAIRRPSWRPGK